MSEYQSPERKKVGDVTRSLLNAIRDHCKKNLPEERKSQPEYLIERKYICEGTYYYDFGKIKDNDKSFEFIKDRILQCKEKCGGAGV